MDATAMLGHSARKVTLAYLDPKIVDRKHAADVLEELDGVRDAAPPQAPPPELDEPQRRVWEFLAGGPRHLDEMAQQLRLAVPQLAGALLTLEMKKVVRRLPGNRYERFA